MKWKIASYMTLGCVFTFGAINALRSDAQQPGSPAGLPPQAAGPGALGPGPSTNYAPQPRFSPPSKGMEMGLGSVTSDRGLAGEMVYGPNRLMVPQTLTMLRDSLSKLRSNDASESDKKAARETIEKFLKDEFERDQKNRMEHVERLEEQVFKLRKQLDKRQESQSKIIALRMQLLENDAEGLSFPEGFNALQNMNDGISYNGGYPIGGYPIGGYPPNTSYGVSPSQ